MAAIQGLPPNFLTTMKQMMNSPEAIVCFLHDLDTTWLYRQAPEIILKELQILTAPFHRSLELLLSYGVWADYLSDWLGRTFPSPSALDWTSTGIHLDVLRRLQDYIQFELPAARSEGERHAMAQDRSFVKYAPLAIDNLLKMNFSTEPVPQAGKVHGKPATRKRPSQAERKRQAKKEERQGEDEGASSFQLLDLTTPKSEQEAMSVSEDLALRLRGLLKRYLVIIQNEDVYKRIQESFVTKPRVEDVLDAKPRLDAINTGVREVGPASSLLFSQPLKAALYFDSAFGFGQWEIIISNRGIRDIRTAYKKNRPFFDIVMKKIKELSNAHFSEDNQKRLNKGNDSVPVFEAKMTGDTRLVYQIDCISEYHTETKVQERQVIRIFGLYNHTQLNRIWDTLGFQLAQKGREYLNRCSVRTLNRDKTLVVPSVFPPTDTRKDDSISNLPRLPKEDLEEIHSILVLEKFTTFSKELRNSILAELDVQHVFNMSPQEMEIIEHPFSCYVLGRSGTGKTTTMLFKMLGLERAYNSNLNIVDLPRPRQLFVTQSRVLATRVEEYFVKLIASLQAGGKTDSELQQLAMEQRAHASSPLEEAMVDEDDDVRWKAILPKKLSLLKDEHFPLFLTFERLLELIIADLLDLQDLPLRLKQTFQLTRAKPSLSYPRFLVDYWDHFPQNLTRGLDPALVFSEIIGVIKGSELSLSLEDRYLDEKTYFSLGERTNYVFASQRPTLYAIFLKYLNRKRQLGDYDSADRTHRVLEAFDLFSVPGTKVDFLYVDEAQDNMLIDSMLLRSMCKNPLGLFWAGDTAQTISVGNSFRFEDLTAFLYRLEERRAKELDLDYGTLQQPSSYVLSTNYRSHGGIVSCAHSIIEIITDLWPDSLDKMAPEKGIVNGLKPFFFGGSSQTAVQFEDFLNGGKRGVEIEFGARQCILVRDESAKTRLRQRVGNIGVIMTLYDSKGLEFDDVLLYQFFEDSTVDFSRWRVLTKFLPGKDAPKFSEIRHASLCSELKFLYVAITRARKKLWIYDSSDKAEPLRVLWTHNELIENFEPGSSTQLPQFAVASSRTEWKEAGKKFFKNKNYTEAMHCFHRAGLNRQADIAQAYQYRKEAQRIIAQQARLKAFMVAARAFADRAHEATNSKERRICMHNAGECFANAEAFSRAAEAYREAEEYDSALKIYRKEGMFDEGVQIIKDGEDKMDATLVEGFKDVAKLFYLKDQEIEKAKELFDSADDTLAYLEDNPFLDESHALLLEDLGKNMEAADVHLSEGRVLDAVRILAADKGDIASLTRAHEIIVGGLWQQMAFGTNTQPQGSAHVVQLLQHASMLKETFLLASEESQDRLAMFSAIHHADWETIRTLGRRFLGRNETMSALLCFSYYFHPSNFPNMRKMNNIQISDVLADLLQFFSRLRFVAENLNPEDQHIQRLFDFRPSTGISENCYLVPTYSWLYLQMVDPDSSEEASSAKEPRDAALFPAQKLRQGLEHGILRYITAIIRHEESECCVVAAFTPCLRVALTGHCRFGDTCYNQHLEASSFDHQWLTAQIRIHLQQVLVCQIMESIPWNFGGGSGHRRFWISRLYHTLNPPNYVLGAWSSIDFAIIPEANKSSAVVKSWCRDLLFGRPGTWPELELSSVHQAADLCFHLDRPLVDTYIHRSSLVHKLRIEPLFYRTAAFDQSKVYVLPELLRALDASHPHFIRAGILFISHVVSGKLCIDINVLCNFVDFICAAVVVAYHRFIWHNIALPRSSCIALLRRLRKDLPPCDISFINVLVAVLGDILKVLSTGENAGYLLYGAKSIEPLPIRRLFIPRICRAMCLVGYNIVDHGLRQMIIDRMVPVRDAEIWHYRLYGRFAMARTWADIEHAVWNPKKDPLLDSDMVQLWWSKRGNPPNPPPPFTTRIVFQVTTDIPNLLRPTLHGRAPLPSNWVGPPKAAAHQQLLGDDATGARTSLLGPRPGEGSTQTEAVQASVTLETTSIEALDAPMDTETIAVEDVIPEDLVEAAKKIMKAYQALLKRRERVQNMAPQQVAYRAFFHSCVENSKNIVWPVDSVYEERYIRVIPHLLVCVQQVQNFAYKEKKAAKDAFIRSTHTELERAKKRMDRIAELFKCAKELHKTLRPQSPFHMQRDTRELDRVVSEVEVLLGFLPRTFADEVYFGIKVAKRWSLETKKAKKPVLNVPDDLENWETHRDEYQR